MSQPPASQPMPPQDENTLIAARREKLRRWREDLGIDPYGRRVDGLIPLAEARAKFDQGSQDAFKASSDAAKGDPSGGIKVEDRRPRAKVAGRCVQHRLVGKLAFIVVRDHTGDLQLSISKAAVGDQTFAVASKLDYGDIVVAEGPVGSTNTGEVCIWVDQFEVHCKSLVPPPEKFHGLQDEEIRYRHRYVDMYATPGTIKTFQLRSKIVSFTRQFMEKREFLEVETPMMQPLAGGAAARPFVTHHNALDMDLYLRIAPELYLKRLLVGGLPRVYEINRNFRNEGIDKKHNPEFTMMEVYEAFGDCWSMLELTEALVNNLVAHLLHLQQDQARHALEERWSSLKLLDEIPRDAMSAIDWAAVGDEYFTMPILFQGLSVQSVSIPSAAPFDKEFIKSASITNQFMKLPYGDLMIDYSRPFARVSYGDLFQKHFGFAMTDDAKVLETAKRAHVENADKMDHWLRVSRLFDEHAERKIDPLKPTFVTDFPSAISPLTRPQPDQPHLSYRWELFIAGMEIANSYTELNDPDVQLAKFTEQLKGADEEVTTFRALDMDFIHALRVGMPPAGGLGVGIDRLIMLLTNSPSIRDVILFPLMRPESSGGQLAL